MRGNCSRHHVIRAAPISGCGGDPLALADNLMEPFRPTIDLHVHRLLEAGIVTVSDARAELVGALSALFETDQDVSPLSQVLVRLTHNLARSFESGKAKLTFPRTFLPEDEAQDE